MRNLEEEQRKMRERMKGSKPKKEKFALSAPIRLDESTDIKTLLKRIEDLESENADLQRRISALGKTQSQTPSYESDDRERRHLFMKYSNVRRY